MALLDMQTELRGSVPKLPYAFAKTLINRAWGDIRDSSLWSFQLFEGQWITPAQISSIGSVSTTIGSNVVSLDATATSNLASVLPTQPYSLITQRQFRIGLSGIYNIWGYNPNGGGVGLGTLTLDRPFGEASYSGATNYQIYQCYYVPQVGAGAATQYLSDFRSWISVRNIQLFNDLFVDRYTRQQVDALDPQRMIFTWPTDVIPYARDSNPQSSTYGIFMWELWGGPLYQWVHSLMGIRRSADLSQPTDTLPAAVGEDSVVAKAKYYAYQWAEANRDLSIRSTGPDFKFLMGVATKEYTELMRKYRREDREQVDNWFFVRRGAYAGSTRQQYYSTLSGYATPGGMP